MPVIGLYKNNTKQPLHTQLAKQTGKLKTHTAYIYTFLPDGMYKISSRHQ